jgi:hypothetical protein
MITAGSENQNCCRTETPMIEKEPLTDRNPLLAEGGCESVVQRCDRCQRQGRPVSRKTILLMLKPDFLDQAMHGNYRFCAAPDCSIVYFDEEGNQQFTIDDLRVRVGLKVTDEPVPLCYCFGFDERHIRDELARTGTTTIPQTISQLIREGLCACDARNPSGVCCLGEVNRIFSFLRERTK